MNKILSVLIAALMLAGILVPFASAADEPFVPVLRFVASSDTHVRDNNNTTIKRIGKMMDMAYSLAESDANYTALDALLVAGDLTNDGTKTEFVKFNNAVNDSLRDGTRFMGVVAKNHDGYKMSRQELRDYYTSLSGVDADFHIIINGFHFIGLSASADDSVHYSTAQLNWLKEELDAATESDPTKPVFVMHHEHNSGTVYGSSSFDGWGVSFFNDILKDYPQVVDFSGHSHYPLNDPRSVWQGEFTAIGTGAVYYAEFTIDDVRTYHPDDAYDTATCWIVEVDADGDIRLRGMDINASAVLCEYYLNNPADPENRDFTPEKQRNRSTPPVFDEGAKVSVQSHVGKYNVIVPAARSTDGMPVVLYRAEVKNENGETIDKKWVLPKYYNATEENEIVFEFDGEYNDEYSVSVTAETAYGISSDPLESTSESKAKVNVFVKFFNMIARFFTNLIEKIKSWF